MQQQEAVSSVTAISPDGRRVAAMGPHGRVWVYPCDGGPPRVVEGLPAAWRPLQWSADGDSLFVRSPDVPSEIHRFTLGTRRMARWAKLNLSEADRVWQIRIARDSRSYAYSVFHRESELYLVSGLRPGPR